MASSTTTANDVITAALRKLKVIAEGETPSAAATTDALAELNDMMADFRNQGIDYDHAPLDLADEIPLEPRFYGGLKSALAVYLASEYERQPDSVDAQRTLEMRQALQAAYPVEDEDMEVDGGLLNMPSSFWGTGNAR